MKKIEKINKNKRITVKQTTKIVYVCNSDFGRHGNIGFRTYHVAKETYKQKKLGRIICRGNAQKDVPKKFIKYVFPGYRIFNLGLSFITQFIWKKFPARPIQLHLFDWVVSKKIKKIDADVLHIYEYAPRTIKQAKRQGMKVILDTQMAHGKTADKIFNKNRKHVEENVSAKYANKIIASSQFVVDSYIDSGIDVNKIELIPHGVDLNKFKFSNKKITKKFTCLYVGLVETRKGIEYLIKAWTELNLKNSELVLCGRLNLSLRKQIKKWKKIRNIKFLGFTDPKKYYKNADAFIFPSMLESSAKVLYEAMAAELPIITTFNSGPIFKDGTAGFIIPIRDYKIMKEKLKYLYDNPKQRVKMGKLSRKLVLKHSWKNYGKKLNKLYAKLFS
ncbi:glycosyltransferase family 4 protein [Candidatus Woesearchaeota archaeon]|jgi:glycosyltransferase involved in cell wall biosynthesis|nr:glycosyltransferase family 4 protein [Candidatus Woesearchaeota archaeon]MBT7367629.1 glycosyltransferase family 4 protein [Candidatus Woesearchaeota archaeon]